MASVHGELSTCAQELRKGLNGELPMTAALDQVNSTAGHKPTKKRSPNFPPPPMLDAKASNRELGAGCGVCASARKED